MRGLLACLGLLAALAGAGGVAGALEQQIVLGREDAWRDFPLQEGLVRRTGLWGSLDLFLREDEYAAAGDTDLLLHFNEEPFREATGHYQVERGKALLAPEVRRLGAASAGFTGERRGLELTPLAGALFERRTSWGDFTVEFWLRPSLLDDGEEILAWAGSRWLAGRAEPQEVRCLVRSRRLAWEFQNFFGAEQARGVRIELQGLTPLLPRAWRHHLLRFDGGSGLLEYLVDGVPEAVTQVRAEPGGPALAPYTGEADTAPLVLGRGFTGFLDELRISRSLVDAPVLARFADRAGVAVSSAIDLGATGTRLKRIEAVYRAESDSGVFFYYRIADRLVAEDVEGSWIQVRPGQELKEVRGRFVQLRLELFPDGARGVSPQLSELRVVYEPDLPPAPPAGLSAVAGSGRVRLRWNAVREEDVRGYLVYYGSSPGSYHGRDADRGPSPIDAGPATEITLNGLENGRLYYFAVVAYDATDPPHRSLFSREVSARPSGALP